MLRLTIQLLLAGVCISSPTRFRSIASIKRQASEIDTSYDYVIIGGGQGGLVVANRLTEDPTKTVLVVEYGTLDNNDPTIIYPPRNFAVNPAYVYSLQSIPQPGLGNRTARLLAGAVVGGGSAVNGMFFDRGAAEDYDNWARLGNPGWDFESLLPYFRKATNFTPPIPEIERGWNVTYDPEAYGDGPVQATFPAYLWPAQRNQWKAWEELGVSHSTTPASGDAVGVFWVPTVQDPVLRTRSFARTAYHDVSKTRPNYHLLINHKVLNISISEEKRATGITFQARNGTGEVVKVNATKEVVLAAGTVHSPQILQRSGVGPRALLEKARVPVRINAPGVGQNFQDHPYGPFIASYQKDVIPNPGMLQTDSSFKAYAQELWDTNRTGPYTMAAGTSAIFLPLKTVTEEYQEIADSASASTYFPPAYAGPLLGGYRTQSSILAERLRSSKSAIMESPFSASAGLIYILQKPFSRGSINLNTTDIYAEPIVDFQVLTHPIDLKLLIEMFRITRKWIAASPNQELGAVEGDVTANLTTDEEIGRFLTASVTPTTSHPAGTNAMMPPELGGVVSDELLVHGLSGLSIVDASIIPLIPSTHLCATVYAIAEKAADLIKARASLL